LRATLRLENVPFSGTRGKKGGKRGAMKSVSKYAVGSMFPIATSSTIGVRREGSDMGGSTNRGQGMWVPVVLLGRGSRKEGGRGGGERQR